MKNSKKGISLIVLVITIIVIIILAAAVILTLNNNNPINEANDARYRSDLANMQAVFTNVVAKIMAYNQAVVSITANENIVDTVSYTVTDAANASNASGTITFATAKTIEQDANLGTTSWYTGKSLPRYKAGTTVWSVNQNGNLSLKVGDTKSYSIN